MKRRCLILALMVAIATGCGRWQPAAPRVIQSQRLVTVSAENPFIDVEDGITIPVDDLAPGQSMQFMVTHYRDFDGNISVEVDTVAEPVPRPAMR